MGRPRHEFDWFFLDSMLGLDASLDYIATKLIIYDIAGPPEDNSDEAQRKYLRDFPEVNVKTINAKAEMIELRIKERYGITFTEYRSKKIDPLRMKLRQKQVQLALEGNVTMLIWLGKQYLEQTDVQSREFKKFDDTLTKIGEKIDILRLVRNV